MRSLTCLIFFLVFFCGTAAFAQDIDCSDPLNAENPDCFDVDPDSPIDGGVVFLLAAAAFYSIKRLKDVKEGDDCLISDTNA